MLVVTLHCGVNSLSHPTGETRVLARPWGADPTCAPPCSAVDSITPRLRAPTVRRGALNTRLSSAPPVAPPVPGVSRPGKEPSESSSERPACSREVPCGKGEAGAKEESGILARHGPESSNPSSRTGRHAPLPQNHHQRRFKLKKTTPRPAQ